MNYDARSAPILLGLLLAACSINPLGAMEPTLAPTLTPTPTRTQTLVPTITLTFSVPPTLVPSETPDFFVCPNSPEVRVAVGAWARVTETNGLPLRVRSQPVLNPDFVLTQIPEGFAFEIIGGPACTSVPLSESSLVYWEIDMPTRNLTGWVAEGDGEGYFIEPWIAP